MEILLKEIDFAVGIAILIMLTCQWKIQEAFF